MSKIVELKKESDVKKVLEEMLKRADHFEFVMIAAINKDGSQFMTSSTGSMMQKSFLISFLNAWMLNWYQRDES